MKVAKPETETVTGARDLTDYQALLWSWMLTLEVAGKSLETRKVYRVSAEQLGAHLLEQGMPVHVAAITREHVESYLLELRRQHPTSSTVATRYKGLRQWFKWLVEEHEIEASPMINIKKPTYTEKEIPILPDVAVKRMLDDCKGQGFDDRRDLAILRVFLATPLRRSEIANLSVTDVDLSARTVHVTVKGNRQRTVPIDVKAVQALDRYRRIRPTSRWAGAAGLWLGQLGPLTDSGLYQVLRRRAKHAGVEGFHPHLFRHKFADSWLRAEGQERDLMRLGGWRSAEVMRKYAENLAEERAIVSYRRLSPGDRF
jgi:site-specific recombinase XerD